MKEGWLSVGALCGEPGGKGDLLDRGTPKNSKVRLCFHGGPFWRTWRGRSFRRTFERRVKFLVIRRTFTEEFERRKRRLWKGVTLLIRPPMRNLEGVHLPRLSRDRCRALETEHLLLN
jgi:hypothetical protein